MKHLARGPFSGHNSSMATDYEQYYRDNAHGLGEPTREFVTFFNSYALEGAQVLDVGCGQGRDALFIARLGHSVTAVDQSPTGIRDLKVDARRERLRIHAEVADICDFDWRGPYNVIVVDRTLHMLLPDQRGAVLRELIKATTSGSYLLIADERSNLPAFKAALEDSDFNWLPALERRGFLFVQRD